MELGQVLGVDFGNYEDDFSVGLGEVDIDGQEYPLRKDMVNDCNEWSHNLTDRDLAKDYRPEPVTVRILGFDLDEWKRENDG